MNRCLPRASRAICWVEISNGAAGGATAGLDEVQGEESLGVAVVGLVLLTDRGEALLEGRLTGEKAELDVDGLSRIVESDEIDDIGDTGDNNEE